MVGTRVTAMAVTVGTTIVVTIEMVAITMIVMVIGTISTVTVEAIASIVRGTVETQVVMKEETIDTAEMIVRMIEMISTADTPMNEKIGTVETMIVMTIGAIDTAEIIEGINIVETRVVVMVEMTSTSARLLSKTGLDSSGTFWNFRDEVADSPNRTGASICHTI